MNDLAKIRLPFAAAAVLGAVALCFSVWPGKASSQVGPRFSSAEELRAAIDACRAKPSADPGTCSREVFFFTGADLEEAIRNAGPTDIFVVGMEFDEPARLGRVRDVAIQLAIPQLLASPELPAADGDLRELPPLGLGTLYEELDAWPGEVCKAVVDAALSRFEIPNGARPEDWPVRSIRLSGPAFAVQQLVAGSLLPRARLLYGLPVDPGAARSMRGTVARDVAQPIRKLADMPMPVECQSFAYQQDGEVLYGRSSDSNRAIHVRGDSDSRLLQELAKLTPDTRINLGIEFEDFVTLETLGTLVERYSIDGLMIRFGAADDATQGITMVELGIDGAPLSDQIQYYRCLLRSQEQAAPSSSASRLSIATVYLDVASTWSLLADPNVSSAELHSQVSADDWNLMKSYLRQPIAERQRLSASISGNCTN